MNATRPLSRRNLLIGGAWLFAAGLCNRTIASSRLGTHGMILFGGNDGLYGYHLAMFHAPHDRQVLIRLSAQDPALDALLRSALTARSGLWTVHPERFDLERLAPAAPDPLGGFKADVVHGHFERGGRTIHANVALRVERVVAFRPLAAEATKAKWLHYDIIGEGDERFLVKRIEQRPDFDQIVSLRTTSRSGQRTLTLRAAPGLTSPSMVQLAQALSKQADLVATELVQLYDDRADLQ